jgi:hypothetical protein
VGLAVASSPTRTKFKQFVTSLETDFGVNYNHDERLFTVTFRVQNHVFSAQLEDVEQAYQDVLTAMEIEEKKYQ